jgi:hypothetical protein
MSMTHRFISLAVVAPGIHAKVVAGVTAVALGLISAHATAEAQSSTQARNADFASAQVQRNRSPFQKTVEVVVRFKDDSKVKHIVDAFWKAPEVARARFHAFKQGRPEMSAATLVRVTYSNELVLTYLFDSATEAQRLAEARAIAAKLAALPDIAYAEPDLSFQTQY